MQNQNLHGLLSKVPRIINFLTRSNKQLFQAYIGILLRSNQAVKVTVEVRVIRIRVKKLIVDDTKMPIVKVTATIMLVVGKDLTKTEEELVMVIVVVVEDLIKILEDINIDDFGFFYFSYFSIQKHYRIFINCKYRP